MSPRQTPRGNFICRTMERGVPQAPPHCWVPLPPPHQGPPPARPGSTRKDFYVFQPKAMPARPRAPPGAGPGAAGGVPQGPAAPPAAPRVPVPAMLRDCAVIQAQAQPKAPQVDPQQEVDPQQGPQGPAEQEVDPQQGHQGPGPAVQEVDDQEGDQGPAERRREREPAWLQAGWPENPSEGKAPPPKVLRQMAPPESGPEGPPMTRIQIPRFPPPQSQGPPPKPRGPAARRSGVDFLYGLDVPIPGSQYLEVPIPGSQPGSPR